MNKLIAVSIGDINGIGIKILIKEWKNNNINNFVLFTNLKLINNYILNNKLNIKINDYSVKFLSTHKYNDVLTSTRRANVRKVLLASYLLLIIVFNDIYCSVYFLPQRHLN